MTPDIQTEVENVGQRVWRYARRWHPRADRDDCVQTAHLMYLLTGDVEATLVKTRRAVMRELAQAAKACGLCGANPPARADDAVGWADVADVIDAVTDPYARDYLELRVLGGLSWDEVQKQMGISHSTLARVRQRASSIMLSLLEDGHQ